MGVMISLYEWKYGSAACYCTVIAIAGYKMDMDGPLLLAEDIASGLTYDQEKLQLQIFRASELPPMFLMAMDDFNKTA